MLAAGWKWSFRGFLSCLLELLGVGTTKGRPKDLDWLLIREERGWGQKILALVVLLTSFSQCYSAESPSTLCPLPACLPRATPPLRSLSLFNAHEPLSCREKHSLFGMRLSNSIHSFVDRALPGASEVLKMALSSTSLQDPAAALLEQLNPAIDIAGRRKHRRETETSPGDGDIAGMGRTESMDK